VYIIWNKAKHLVQGKDIEEFDNFAVFDFTTNSGVFTVPYRSKFRDTVFDVNIFPTTIYYKQNYVVGLQINQPEYVDLHINM
jgi:hypothetical protein